MVLLRAKVAVVGDCATGKSSIVKMFCERTFPNQYSMTLGANVITSKAIPVPIDKHYNEEKMADRRDEFNQDIDGDNEEERQMRKEISRQEPIDEVELYIFDIGASSIYENVIDEFVCLMTKVIS